MSNYHHQVYHHHQQQQQQHASTSSPGQRQQHQQQQQFHPSSHFTEEMRDRQARGKDPYQQERNDNQRHRETPYAKTERQRVARNILDQPELLMMQALMEGNSIPQTRLKYNRIFCDLECPPNLQSPPHARQQQPQAQQLHRAYRQNQPR